jgi:LysM repeat protein
MLAQQESKSPDKTSAKASKKGDFKEYDPTAFDEAMSQFKMKPYPNPKGPLADDVVAGGSLPETTLTIQRKTEEEEEGPIQGKKDLHKSADLIQMKPDKSEGHPGVQKHLIVWGETLSGIAKHYNTSIESLAKWNSISNVNLIYAGNTIMVSDPARPIAKTKFDSYPPVKESTGWLFGEIGVQSRNVSSLMELGMASIFNADIANITGDLLDQVKADPDFILKENLMIAKIKADPRYRKEAFFASGMLSDKNGTPGVEFGGKRWSTSGESWSKLGSNNPIFHKETWGVAANELTWALRHATVKYWVEVNAAGALTIQYHLYDVLDLTPQGGRSDAYKNISKVLGFGYHTVLGGNKNLQTRAQWSVTK